MSDFEQGLAAALEAALSVVLHEALDPACTGQPSYDETAQMARRAAAMPNVVAALALDAQTQALLDALKAESIFSAGDFTMWLAFHDALVQTEGTTFLRARVERLEAGIDAALHELGVPQTGYPAPVANAVDILRAALASEPYEPSEAIPVPPPPAIRA